MRYRRSILVVLLILLLPIVITGCRQTYDYSFAQSIDHVEKVEICQYEYKTHTSTSLITLNNNQARALLTDIDALKCKKHFGDHTQDYGEVVIYITYTDGTAEVIGLWNVALVDEEGLWHIGIEYFDAKELYAIMVKYTDEDLLPDLSASLQ